jgi:trehalose 6-phosphate synthase
MRRLRAQVSDHNIYRWAGQLLSAVGKMVPEPLPRATGMVESLDEDSDLIPRADHIAMLRLAGS